MAAWAFKPTVEVQNDGAKCALVDTASGRSVPLTLDEAFVLEQFDGVRTPVQLAVEAKAQGRAIDAGTISRLFERLFMEGFLEKPSDETRAAELQPLRMDNAVPQFRGDVKVARKPAPSKGLYEVTDPTAGKTFTLYDFEVSIARMLDGRRKVSEVIEAAARIGIPVTLDSFQKFVRQLRAYHFLEENPEAAREVGRVPGTAWAPRARWTSEVRHLYQGALKMFRLGRLQEARDYLTALVQVDPGNPEALEMLARVEEYAAAGEVVDVSFDELHGPEETQPGPAPVAEAGGLPPLPAPPRSARPAMARAASPYPPAPASSAFGGATAASSPALSAFGVAPAAPSPAPSAFGVASTPSSAAPSTLGAPPEAKPPRTSSFSLPPPPPSSFKARPPATAGVLGGAGQASAAWDALSLAAAAAPTSTPAAPSAVVATRSESPSAIDARPSAPLWSTFDAAPAVSPPAAPLSATDAALPASPWSTPTVVEAAPSTPSAVAAAASASSPSTPSEIDAAPLPSSTAVDAAPSASPASAPSAIDGEPWASPSSAPSAIDPAPSVPPSTPSAIDAEASTSLTAAPAPAPVAAPAAGTVDQDLPSVIVDSPDWEAAQAPTGKATRARKGRRAPADPDGEPSPSATPKRRHAGRWVALALLAIVCGGAFTVPLPNEARLPCLLHPKIVVPVLAKGACVVKEVIAKDLQWVESGAVLVTLEPGEEQALSDRLAGELSKLEGKVAALQGKVDKKKLPKAEAAVSKAQREADAAQRVVLALEAARRTPKSRRARARAALEKKNRALAKAREALARVALTDAIAAANASLSAKRAELEAARAAIPEPRLVASAAGLMLFAPGTAAGRKLAAGEELGKLQDTRTLETELEVPSADAPRLRSGGQVSIFVDGHTFQARGRPVEAGAARVGFDLDDPQRSLGQSPRCEVRYQGAPLTPFSWALQYAQGRRATQ